MYQEIHEKGANGTGSGMPHVPYTGLGADSFFTESPK
jgi:hypothetical protein